LKIPWLVKFSEMEKTREQMYEKLLKMIANLGSPRILVVGDFMLDTYIYGDALRISPEAPVPVLKVHKTEHSAGGAARVAIDLAALGGTACCLGVVGKDERGRLVKQILSESGVDISGLITVPDRPTISKQRLIGLAQHRHQQQLFRMDEESGEPLTDEQNQKILDLYKENLKQVSLVCLQDYNKNLLSSSVCREMIESARKENKKVLVDPSLTSDYNKYIGASVITPNRQEASGVLGFEITGIETASKAAGQLAEKLKLEAVLITLDKQGAFLKTPDISEAIPTKARSVYDVTGAGDIVLATMAVTLAAGCDYKTAVQLANIAGGIEVEKFGAATVSTEEIVNEIIREKRTKTGKIYTINTLIEQLNWHRKQNQSVVFTNGCFDIVHRGHIEFLKFCKSQGDVVVLGLNSDNSVRQIKGPERPINNQYDRAAVLSALETIDYLTVFDEPDPLELIKKVRPDILVKGRDWADKGVVGQDFVEAYGGKVVLSPLVEGKSTTSVIQKMKSIFKKI